MDRRPHRGPSLRTQCSILSATAAAVVLMAVPDRELTLEEAAAVRARHEVRLAADDLRAAIEEYRRDHRVWPGFPPAAGHGRRASEDWLVRQLTMASNDRGEVVPTPEDGYPHGPYLAAGIPANPVNGRTEVRLIEPGAGWPVAEGLSGWIYDASNGDVRVDAAGVIPFTESRYFDL